MAVPRKKLKKTKTPAFSSRRKLPFDIKQLSEGKLLTLAALQEKHFGVWVGNDANKLLEEVIRLRGRF